MASIFRFREPDFGEAAAAEPRTASALDVDDPVAGDPTLRDVATEREGALPAEEAAIPIVDGSLGRPRGSPGP